MQRFVTLLGIWAAGTATAVGASSFAVTLAGQSVTGTHIEPLSNRAVDEQLAAAPRPVPTTTVLRGPAELGPLGTAPDRSDGPSPGVPTTTLPTGRIDASSDRRPTTTVPKATPRPTSPPTTARSTEVARPAPTTTATTRPPLHSASFSGQGGSVFATCSGTYVSSSAKPAEGYTLYSGSFISGDEAQIGFYRSNPNHQTRISIRCEAGYPVLKEPVRETS